MLWWQSALQYIVSISFTVLVASLSYKYIEYPFMRKKRKFTTVISGEDART
jgi:peptidoglycan/LPS O-acetylase OafA/YrhL